MPTWGHSHLGESWPGEIRFREEIGSIHIAKLSWFIVCSYLSVKKCNWTIRFKIMFIKQEKVVVVIIIIALLLNAESSLPCMRNSPSGKAWRRCRNTDKMVKVTAAYFPWQSMICLEIQVHTFLKDCFALGTVPESRLHTDTAFSASNRDNVNQDWKLKMPYTYVHSIGSANWLHHCNKNLPFFLASTIFFSCILA